MGPKGGGRRPGAALACCGAALAFCGALGLCSCSARKGADAPRLSGSQEAERGEILAAAVDFCDSRYSVTRGEAKALGLVPLESIRLPRRALAVEGLFPGEEGYPFEGPEARKGGGGDAPFLLDAVGDIQIGPEEGSAINEGEAGIKRLFGSAFRELARPAILVGNLEGPVSARGDENPRKRFHFRFPPGTDAALKAAGFDLLLFANNHAFDYGDIAFEDSLAEARKAGMPLVGAGDSLPEALEGQRLPAPGMGKTGMMRFIGFGNFPVERSGFTTDEASAGPARKGINSDVEATLAAIREGAEAGDFVAVLAHGGNEYKFEPAPEIVKRYREFIDAGAGLVIGSHPHLLQGAESYRGGLIAWSLGNFLFTGEAEPEPALESAILQVLFYKGKIRGIGLKPIFAGIKGTELSAAPSAVIAAFGSRCRVSP